MSTHAKPWTPEGLAALAHDGEQRQAIAEAIERYERDRHLTVARSERFHQRGIQTFAVFGSFAREVSRSRVIEEDGARVEYLPAPADGQMVHIEPDEGSGGLLHLMRFTRWKGAEVAAPRWTVGMLPTGWLYTRELDEPAAAIAARITNEIDAGGIVFGTPASR